MNAVTIAIDIDDQNPGHTRGRLFVGRNPGARGMSGQVVFRTDELTELAERGVIEIVGADPKVSPAGDRRENSVPCSICRTDTWAINGLCDVHQAEKVGV